MRTQFMAMRFQTSHLHRGLGTPCPYVCSQALLIRKRDRIIRFENHSRQLFLNRTARSCTHGFLTCQQAKPPWAMLPFFGHFPDDLQESAETRGEPPHLVPDHQDGYVKRTRVPRELGKTALCDLVGNKDLR